MTSEQIERRVERFTDHADRLLMSRQIDQATYDKMMADLNTWAEAQFAKCKEPTQ